jgi:hypothetical protein
MLTDWSEFSITDRTMGPSGRETDCGSVLEQCFLTNRLPWVQVRIWLGLPTEEIRPSDRLPDFSCRIRRSDRLYLPVKLNG